MKDFLSKMDKKYLYILGGLLGVIFLIIIILVIVKSCQGPSNNYKSVESKMVSATKRYLKSKGQSTPQEYDSRNIKVDELVSAGFLKDMSKLLSDPSCTGSVSVYNYGGELLYIPDLQCTNYKTQHLKDVIKKNSLIQLVDGQVDQNSNSNSNDNTLEEEDVNDNSNTTSNSNSNGSPRIVSTEDDGTGRNYISGLYEEDGDFVFKGLNPNNYITFANTKAMFRILDIDSNGKMRLLYITSYEKTKIVWDAKYNSDIKQSKGITEFKNSRIYSAIYSKYNAFKPSIKKHIAYNNICIGKRNSKETKISKEIDCSLVLEKVYPMLLRTSDYARASLDEHCQSIYGAACDNYNYLRGTKTTWTSNVSDENTYQAYVLQTGRPKLVDASKTYGYYIVYAINGDELYIKGNGTYANPYIIENSSK